MDNFDTRVGDSMSRISDNIEKLVNIEYNMVSQLKIMNKLKTIELMDNGSKGIIEYLKEIKDGKEI